MTIPRTAILFLATLIVGCAAAQPPAKAESPHTANSSQSASPQRITSISPQLATQSVTSNSAHPNIIVILADDLGYADVGAQGQLPDVKTPNIDSIAKSGVRFTNGYVTCPVCSPSRAGFLTGRYQERFGHEFNPGGNSPEVFGLPLDQITLPQLMKQAGYVTGMVGKWHEGTREEYRPQKRGFDEFFGFLGGAHPYVNLTARGDRSILRGNTPVDESEYLTDAFSREASAFIERHKAEPFFLYLPYNAVHQPQQVTGKYLDRFPGVKDEKRRNLLAMLSAEDDGVGRVLDTVRKNHLEENTLIFFFSDNGGPTDGNGSRNKPLSGYKGQVWEGGVREPFMVQWKNHIPAGKVLDQPVISMDIFATSAAAAEAKMPADRVMDGVDLMPLLTGKTNARPHRKLYWRFGQQWALRDADWKLVHFDGFGEKLFDLSKDPGEKNDQTAAHPQIASELRNEFQAWNKDLAEPRWKNKPKFNEALDRIAKQGSMKPPRAGRGSGKDMADEE